MFDEFRVEIDMEQKMCSNCKKSSTEYYELLLQIRFVYFNNVDEIKKEVFDIIDKNFFGINKFEELDNGFDVYFRDHGHMNKVLSVFQKKFMVEEKRSKKLIGRDKLISKDKYRYFQSITIINLKKGDIVQIKGERYLVRNIQNNDIYLMQEDNGSKKMVSYSIIKDYFMKIDG